jgi:transcriptional regulator with XRE-family HTH domain
LAVIGKNVRRRREAAGLSQENLAVLSGISTRIVSELERGTSQNPRVATLLALAGALGCGVDDLLRGFIPPPTLRTKRTAKHGRKTR